MTACSHLLLGWDEGSSDGWNDGSSDGVEEGWKEGVAEGDALGLALGKADVDDEVLGDEVGMFLHNGFETRSISTRETCDMSPRVSVVTTPSPVVYSIMA